MLQIAFIRENQEKVIKALAKRNIDAKVSVEEVVQLDEKRRATQVELDGILSESNKLSTFWFINLCKSAFNNLDNLSFNKYWI